MELYLDIRNNETMWFEGEWMELGNIILSEISQAQKDKRLHVFSHTWRKMDPKDKHAQNKHDNTHICM
jgi:hypothetical protein